MNFTTSAVFQTGGSIHSANEAGRRITSLRALALLAWALVAVPQIQAQVPYAPPEPYNPNAPAATPYGAPAPAPVPLRSPAELDQMLAPIALYPDPLIAEILPAATQPAQIVMADRYTSGGGDINQIDYQPWDGSVKALARYPFLLRWLDDNLAWTTAVGQAFLYQQGDVMDSIQRLRAQALALGNLVSTPQQTVVNENGLIEILPANPQVVYVPAYQPDVVYTEAPPQPGGFLTFGFGLPIGIWFNHDFDWEHHHLMIWHHEHPRPSDWWYRRPADRFSAERNASVWRPRAGGLGSEHDREGRGWYTEIGRSAPTQARREEPRVPERSSVPANRETRPSRPTRVEPTPTAPSVSHEARPTPSRTSPPIRVTPPHAVAQPFVGSARPAAGPPEPRSATGALIGVQSAPETRQYSVRGQQSRAAAAMPQAAPARSIPSAPAPAVQRGMRR